jgi:hypothetical protein
MPSTDSGGPEKVDAMPLERVVGMARNEWTASIGIDGRHGPDYAIGNCSRSGACKRYGKVIQAFINHLPSEQKIRDNGWIAVDEEIRRIVRRSEIV